MIRFDPFVEDDDSVPGMEPATLGEYVLFDDYAKELRIKDMELNLWKDAFRKLAGEL